MFAVLKSPLGRAIWRPTVLGVMVYVSLLAILVIWVICTLRTDTFHAAFLDERFLGFSLYEIWTAANAVWLVAVALELKPALRAPRLIRRGQVSGVIGAFLVLVVVQVLAQAMKGAAEAWAP